MTIKYKTLGTHLLLDIIECEYEKLNDINFLEDILKESVNIAKATLLNSFKHKFNPQGVSIVMTLSESHISIHTFPELGKATLDMYTCGDCYPNLALDYIITMLKPLNYNIKTIIRG